MDIEHLDHILKIAETKSITRAAEECFVTQSALNQQLQKLEKELGAPLFFRNRGDWQLTEAGVAFTEMAREMQRLQQNTYSRIADMTEKQNRQLRLGLIPERGVNMFTNLYPKFHQRFPEAYVEPIEGNVRQLQKQIREGRIDMALMTLREDQKDGNIYFHMNYEEIVLAVPAAHPLAAQGGENPRNAPIISLDRFSDQPFMTMYTASTMHEIEVGLFQEAGFEPRILFQTNSNVSKWRMVNVGVGCALLPLSFAEKSDAIRYFRMASRPSWEITICCRKGSYINQIEQSFLELCREYWSQI